MKRNITLCLFTAALAAGVRADERIVQANNLESLTLAVTHASADLQSRDQAGDAVFNRMAGPQIAFGYANTHTRAVLGMPGFYTRLDVALGLGRQDFVGTSIDPSAGTGVAGTGPYSVQTLAAHGRIGYGWAFGPGGALAVTPFVGIAPQLAHRGATAISGTATNLDNVVEIGGLAQATVLHDFVLGMDASVGKPFGSWQVDNRNVLEPAGRIGGTVSIFLDYRADADNHERLVVRQGSLRFGEPAQTTGSLEPRRTSAFSVMLEFGTEGKLLEELFH